MNIRYGLHFHHMSLQSICPTLDYGWKFIFLVFFVWLSFCVRFGMLYQKVCLWWYIITLAAFIWPFSIVYFQMFCEVNLMLVSFAASVLPRVRPHVAVQITRMSASIIALVTLERLFSCVIPHHMLFQITSCNAGKLARCASVRLFPRMGSFVLLQIAWFNCSIIAQVAFVWFLSSVFLNVLS